MEPGPGSRLVFCLLKASCLPWFSLFSNIALGMSNSAMEVMLFAEEKRVSKEKLLHRTDGWWC